MSDHYTTLAGSAEARIKIERSEFLAIAFFVEDEPGFFEELAAIARTHFDATHHCWAFRLHERARSSDAGEPAGTAGRPILAAIDGAELLQTGVVVVRWYGGIKLGTGGLARAYREAASHALAKAPRAERYVYAGFDVVVPFDAFGAVYRLTEPPNVVLVRESFGDVNEFVFDVRLSRADLFEKTLASLRLAFRRRDRADSVTPP